MKRIAITLVFITLAFYIFVILSINVQQHTNKPNVEPTHEERVEVVGGEEEGKEEKKAVPLARRVALSSWYDRSVCGQRIYGETCKTANGEIFNEEAHTMACSYDFALGDRVELCYLSKCIVARCTDRGNFAKYGRTFDLSRGLFSKFDDLDLGVIEVEYKTIKRGE